MVRRVLIVVSSYQPAMPANMHRARLLAWCLDLFGWQAEILAPSADFQQPEWLDPRAARFFNPKVSYSEAKPVCKSLFQLLGMHSAGWRGLLPLYREGARLLSTGRFDLVYISTTAFNLFSLGRLWQKRFGVPYVLDFQDPWFRPGSAVTTTRYRLKATVANWLASYLERFAVSGARGLIAVSPNYLAILRNRYPGAAAFESGLSAAIPFGARQEDLAETSRPANLAEGEDAIRRIAYVGVGGDIMHKSFRRLVAGLARVRRIAPDVVNKCRIQLLGTQGGWNEGDAKVLWREAEEAGVGDLVDEAPRVVPYSSAVERAVAADGLIVLGVDDPAYMASKLFLYAFTGKPLLACVHSLSQINSYFEQFPDLGSLMHFSAPKEMEAQEDLCLLEFLGHVVAGDRFSRLAIRGEHSARGMTQRHVELFEACLSGAAQSNPRNP